jgi:hypothetical protein
MGPGVCRGVLLSVALLAAGDALGVENPAANLKKAEEAARANAASPQGRDWLSRNSSTTSRLLIAVLSRCLPEKDGETPTLFSAYVRLTQKGRVREVVTDLDASLGSCMTAGARKMQFPEAPRDDYWIQLNMAASL